MTVHALDNGETPLEPMKRFTARGRHPMPTREFSSHYDASDALEKLGWSKRFRVNQVNTLRAAVSHLDSARWAAETDPTASPALPLRLATTSAFAPIIAHAGRLKANCDNERFMDAYYEMHMAEIPGKLEEIGIDLLDRFNGAVAMRDKAAQKDYTTFAHELTMEMLMFNYGNTRELCVPHNFSRLHPGIAAHNLRSLDQPSRYIKIDGPEPRSPRDPDVITSTYDLQNTADAPLWEGFFPKGTPFPTLLTLLDNDGPDKTIKEIILTGIAQDLKRKLFS